MSKLSQRIWLFAIPVSCIILFQNCSGGGFLLQGGPEQAEFASTASQVPVLTISQAPEQLTNAQNPSFKFAVTTNKFATIKSISCALDLNPAVSCTNGFSAASLLDGDHTLRVRAEDSLGNKSDEVVYLWKVDATKPVVTINQAPSAIVGSTNVGFSFSSSEVANYMCAMDNEVMAACLSPVTRTVTEGSHTFRVQSVDMAKNMSDVMATTFKVDLTAPVITIAAKPVTLSNGNTASFTFTGTDEGVALTVFSCKLDNQAAAACNAGSVNYTNLSEGSHVFSLTGQDSAGNMSAATTYSWTVDVTAPSVPTVTANISSPTKSNAASFLMSATDTNGVKGYECQLDSGAVSACATTGASYSALANGSHTFKVRAIDNAGNVSAFATFNWTVDLVVPVITLSQTPASSTTATDANFVFATSDVGSGVKSVECQLDAGVFAACTSPKAYTGIAVGSHSFNIRVKDQVDNTTLQSYAWTVSAATTPTPSPTMTPTPTPTMTPTPSPTATPAPTATPVGYVPNSLDTMTPGTWVEIANSKLDSVVYSGSLASSLSGNSGTDAIMNAWNGGVFDTANSQLLVWGGGHQDYWGNEVYTFSMNTLKWSRITDPSNISAWSGTTGIYPDGKPSAPHTYDGQVFLPNLGKMFFTGGMDKRGYSYDLAWFFDPTTKIWEQKASFPCGGVGYGQVAAYDPNSGHVFVVTSYNSNMCEFDPVAGTWKKFSTSSLFDYHLSGDVDPVGKRLVAVGSGGIQVYSLATGASSKPATSGDRAVETNGNAPGFVWYPPGKVFVGWNGGKNIYTLDPTTWIWTLRPVVAANTVTPTSPNGNGTFGRFQYDPAHKAFIVVNDVGQNVFIYKPNF